MRGVLVVAVLMLAACAAPPEQPRALVGSDDCRVEPGKLPPGRYEGSIAVERVEERDRDMGEPMGVVHDRAEEHGTLIATLFVGRGQSISGAWAVTSALTTTITLRKNGAQWVTPGDLLLHSGAISGTATEVRLTGGEGMITHYPAAGIVSRTPITAGVADYSSSVHRTYTIDLPLRIDSVSCAEITGTLQYPIGFVMTDPKAPLRWTARRTPAPCDDLPKVRVEEHLVPYPAATFEEFARAAGIESGTRGVLGNTRPRRPDVNGYETDKSTGKVTAVNLTVVIDVTRPVWTATGSPVQRDVRLIDNAVEVIRVHENKHVANYQTVAQRHVCAAHGRSVNEMVADLGAPMCGEINDLNYALDQAEGRIKVVRDPQGAALDVITQPNANPEHATCVQDR